MDYGKNLKYFNSTDKLFYIGLPILIVGAILVVCELLWFFFMPYQMLIGLAIAILGAALAFIPRSLRANEKDIDAIVSAMTDGYAKEVTENLGLEKQILRMIPPTVIGNYIYDEKDILMRRGKDDRKCRTSKYRAAAVICTKNGMVISQKTFSLIDETVTETLHEFLFADIDSLSVVDNEIRHEDGTKIKDSRLILTENGKEVLNLPTIHVIAVDRLCEDINRMIASAKS
jgi:hypothetical protein